MFETFCSKLSELFALTGLGEFRIVLSSPSTPQRFHYSCVTVVEARDVLRPKALVLFSPTLKPFLMLAVFAAQSGDDLQGTRRLGGQSSSAEGDGRTYHQCQVSSPSVSALQAISLLARLY